MPPTQRFGLLGVAAVVLIVAFLALRPGDAATPTVSSNATRPRTTAGTGTSPPAVPATLAAPPGPLLVAGEVTRLRVSRRERVRFRVRSRAADELHVHGYDIRRQLTAGGTVPISFEAGIDGIFEIELEAAGEQLASLRVDP